MSCRYHWQAAKLQVPAGNDRIATELLSAGYPVPERQMREAAGQMPARNASIALGAVHTGRNPAAATA